MTRRAQLINVTEVVRLTEQAFATGLEGGYWALRGPGPRRRPNRRDAEEAGESFLFIIHMLLGLPPALVVDAVADDAMIEEVATRARLHPDTIRLLRQLLQTLRLRTGFKLGLWPRLLSLTGGDLRLTALAVANGVHAEDLDAWAAHGPDEVALATKAAQRRLPIPVEEPPALRRFRKRRRIRIGWRVIHYQPPSPL
jgi:hypothetical protein